MDTQQIYNLSSLIQLPDRDLWLLLKEHHPLVMLKNKFWGRDLSVDEEQWRNSDLAARGDELDSKMEVDSDDDDIPDGEIPKGCYVLDIDIERIPVRSLWVHPDYPKLYNALQHYYDRSITLKGNNAPSAVVTGQPGTGKSFWIFYAVCRCLSEKKAMIWYLHGECYLFVEEGVYVVPASIPHWEFEFIVWTFVDSDPNKDGPPQKLLCPGTRLFVIFVSSPTNERWKRFHKCTEDRIFIMNPWTWGDITRAASIRPPGTIDMVTARMAYKEYGSTPRICLNYVSDQQRFEYYKKEVNDAISRVGKDTLEQLVRNAASLDGDSVSNKICLVSRRNTDNVSSGGFYVAPITPSIRSKIMNQIQILSWDEQVKLYKYFGTVPGSESWVGTVYEILALQRFQKTIVLSVVPLVKPDSSFRRMSTSHIHITNELELTRQQALQATITINIEPLRTEEFRLDDLDAVQREVFYIPKSRKQECFDSLIVIGEILYLFQVSIAETHASVKKKTVQKLKLIPSIPPTSNWRFVFIIPPHKTLTTPQLKDNELKEIALFSAVVDVEEQQ